MRTFTTVARGEIEPGERKAAPQSSGDPKIRGLTDHLSRRYLVSAQAMENLVMAAHEAGRVTRLDPLLILAVMAVESRFNPIAESVMGAKGLMQIIPKYHWDKFPASGEQVVLEPRNNIVAGARILREYVNRTGDLATALQMYNGASSDLDQAYARKVLGEQQRLQQVMRQLRA